MNRLIAMAFQLPRKKGQNQVNHKDGNSVNDKLSNLEWMSPSENIQHSHETNTNRKSHAGKQSVPRYKPSATLQTKCHATNQVPRYKPSATPQTECHATNRVPRHKPSVIFFFPMVKPVKHPAFKNVRSVAVDLTMLHSKLFEQVPEKSLVRDVRGTKSGCCPSRRDIMFFLDDTPLIPSAQGDYGGEGGAFFQSTFSLQNVHVITTSANGHKKGSQYYGDSYHAREKEFSFVGNPKHFAENRYGEFLGNPQFTADGTNFSVTSKPILLFGRPDENGSFTYFGRLKILSFKKITKQGGEEEYPSWRFKLIDSDQMTHEIERFLLLTYDKKRPDA